MATKPDVAWHFWPMQVCSSHIKMKLQQLYFLIEHTQKATKDEARCSRLLCPARSRGCWRHAHCILRSDPAHSCSAAAACSAATAPAPQTTRVLTAPEAPMPRLRQPLLPAPHPPRPGARTGTGSGVRASALMAARARGSRQHAGQLLPAALHPGPWCMHGRKRWGHGTALMQAYARGG